MFRPLALALLFAFAPAVCLGADAQSFSFGGDQYTAGETVSIQSPVAHDAFAAGRDVNLNAPVTGNAHLAGMNVTSGAQVGGNLYAAGFSVSVNAPVAGGISAAGNSILLNAPASVGGNARLAGASVTVSAPVTGSTLVTAQSLTLNGAIGGDLGFYGQNLAFGPGAKVGGMLTIQAPNPIDVPASVAPPDRVKFQQVQNPDYASQAGNAATGVVAGFWPGVWAAVVWWLLLFLVGVAFIALAPKTMTALQAAAATRPWRNLGLGVLAFASALGLVPVAAMTLIGIVLVPFIALFIVILCGLGYIAGAFFLGLRIARAFMPIDDNMRRVALLAAALVVAGLLGAIPVLGWLFSLMLTVFGIGIATVALLDRWTARDARRAAPQPAVTTV